MAKPSHLMPRCTAADAAKITDAIEALGRSKRAEARAFVELVTPKGICEILHGMRRWYSYQTGAVARRVLKHREALRGVMTLDVPVGVFRGFHLPRERDGEDLYVGREGDLPFSRNGGCSSWTTERHLADRFSGASKRQIGVVVQLVSGGDDVETFIAPPQATRPWFNDLYAATMGTSFRWTESEYALRCESVRVKLVAVKR